MATQMRMVWLAQGTPSPRSSNLKRINTAHQEKLQDHLKSGYRVVAEEVGSRDHDFPYVLISRTIIEEGWGLAPHANSVVAEQHHKAIDTKQKNATPPMEPPKE